MKANSVLPVALVIGLAWINPSFAKDVNPTSIFDAVVPGDTNSDWETKSHDSPQGKIWLLNRIYIDRESYGFGPDGPPDFIANFLRGLERYWPTRPSKEELAKSKAHLEYLLTGKSLPVEYLKHEARSFGGYYKYRYPPTAPKIPESTIQALGGFSGRDLYLWVGEYLGRAISVAAKGVYYVPKQVVLTISHKGTGEKPAVTHNPALDIPPEIIRLFNDAIEYLILKRLPKERYVLPMCIKDHREMVVIAAHEDATTLYYTKGRGPDMAAILKIPCQKF